MSRSNRYARTRVRDGLITQTSEETAFLSSQKGQGSSRSADSDDVEDTRTTSTVRRHPSLIRCLLRVYGLSLLKAHLCKLVCDVLLFVGPVLQK